MQHYDYTTTNKPLKTEDEKAKKMLGQVKRIIKLPDRSFNALVDVLKQSKGGDTEEVLHQLYRERDA